MLTARSVIIAVLVVGMLAFLGALVSVLRPPDQSGLGSDTYGTRAMGYKAVFDTLAELGVEQRRGLAPPTESTGKDATLVLWGPESELVDVEPTYLRRLRQWVRDGGRLIIAPQAAREANGGPPRQSRRLTLTLPTNPLSELGLPAIETRMIDVPTDGGTTATASQGGSRRTTSESDSEFFKAELDSYLFPQLFPTGSITVKADGGLKTLTASVSRLEAPTRLQVLDLDLTKPDGAITIVTDKSSTAERQKSAVVAALFKLGAGEVIVASDPAIFDNRLLAQQDNAVLAANLLAAPNRVVVWDEFYHGLTIRGNPVSLLTRPGYGIIAALVVALVGVWIWRQAIFLGPPLAAPVVSRRTMGEYVDAMAHFLYRGSGSLRFMLAELRTGVLWSLRRRFGSYRQRDSLEEVAAAVARRDPAAARQLLDAAGRVDLMLSSRDSYRQRETLQAAKELVDCL